MPLAIDLLNIVARGSEIFVIICFTTAVEKPSNPMPLLFFKFATMVSISLEVQGLRKIELVLGGGKVSLMVPLGTGF